MNAADQTILATLAYFGAFGWPLTPLEVRLKMISSARLGGAGALPDINTVLSRLESLGEGGKISSTLGLFGPADMPEEAFTGRVVREKECARKWRVMRRSAVLLQAVPFVRALLASGSLALGNAGSSSDWDMLVVAASGRLYTARALLLTATWLTGRLRTKHHPVAPDRYCYNHWLTDGALEVRHRSLFTASVLAAVVPVHDPDGLRIRLHEANPWTGDFMALPGSAPFVRRMIPAVSLLAALRRGMERLLMGALGDRLEVLLRRFQQERIAAEPATHAPSGRVVADDTELEFHPRSFEAVALARYNAALSALGLGAHAEEDSGLTK